MKGLIFDIKRYSVNDGPGIRVTVFFKGCPLTCQWCHNPEGIKRIPEEITRIDRVGELEYSRNETVGRWYEADEIIEEVLKDSVFINESGGGVTFSGGEPLLQSGFLYEVLEKCKQMGLHTAVDTSGQVPWEEIERIIPLTSLFLFDLKHADRDLHMKYTGSTNELILSNLRRLADTEARIWIRIPVIPGVNASDRDATEIMSYISGLRKGSVGRISLLPYHKSGSSKGRMLAGRINSEQFTVPGKELMSNLREIFAETGIEIKTGG